MRRYIYRKESAVGPKVYRLRLGAVGQIGSCGGAKAVAVALFAVNGRGNAFLTKRRTKIYYQMTRQGQETEYRTRDDTNENKRKEKESRNYSSAATPLLANSSLRSL